MTLSLSLLLLTCWAGADKSRNDAKKNMTFVVGHVHRSQWTGGGGARGRGGAWVTSRRLQGAGTHPRVPKRQVNRPQRRRASRSTHATRCALAASIPRPLTPGLHCFNRSQRPQTIPWPARQTMERCKPALHRLMGSHREAPSDSTTSGQTETSFATDPLYYRPANDYLAFLNQLHCKPASPVHY